MTNITKSIKKRVAVEAELDGNEAQHGVNVLPQDAGPGDADLSAPDDLAHDAGSAVDSQGDDPATHRGDGEGKAEAEFEASARAWMDAGHAVAIDVGSGELLGTFRSYDALKAAADSVETNYEIVFQCVRDRTPEFAVAVPKAEWARVRQYLPARFWFENSDEVIVPVRGLSLVTPRKEWGKRPAGMQIVKQHEFPFSTMPLQFNPDEDMARFADFAKAVERLDSKAIVFPARDPFVCNVEGVFEEKKSGPVCKSSTPIWADCNGTLLSSGDSGVVLAWLSDDGELHRRCYPKSLLLGDAAIAKEIMTRGGGWLADGRLAPYLASQLQAVVGTRNIGIADQVGWLTYGAKWVYCTGLTVICARGLELDVFPAANLKSVFAKRGTLAEWQQNVFSLVVGNKAALAAVCLSLASALMPFTGVDNGIFHFQGAKGGGKTTLLQICATLFGNGAQPGHGSVTGGDAPYMRKHYATANGLEGLALMYTGAVLLLDELGEGEGRKLGQVVYLLSSGMGKAAMKSDRTLHDQQRWHLNVISTGEISMCDLIIEMEGAILGGQQDRAADLHLFSTPVFTELHGRGDFVAFSRELKRACARYYGTAAEALIQYAADHAEKLIDELRWQVAEEAERLRPKGIDDGQMRVVMRMAAAAVVGKLAVEAGVLTCVPADIDEAIAYLVALWHAGKQRPLARVADYCSQNVHDVALEVDAAHQRAWYILSSTKANRYRKVAAIPADKFEAHFGGDTVRLIARLEAANLLVREQGERRKHRFGNNKLFCYAIDLAAVSEAMGDEAEKLPKARQKAQLVDALDD